jgi:hypothetical protein
VSIPGRKGKEWAAARKACLQGATWCADPNCKYPGIPLDPSNIVNGKPGPLYPTADHLVCVSWTKGWSEADRAAVLNDPHNLRPAHNACNGTRGARSSRRRESATRDWTGGTGT